MTLYTFSGLADEVEGNIAGKTTSRNEYEFKISIILLLMLLVQCFYWISYYLEE